jgi:hypothetical protein
MRWFAIVMATALMAPAAAVAQSSVALPVVPSRAPYPTTVHDQSGRERVTYRIDSSGGYVRGVDSDAGTRWNADISPTGAMKGKDIDGNQWRYDPQEHLYQNLTTGRACAATSVRRICPP